VLTSFKIHRRKGRKIELKLYRKYDYFGHSVVLENSWWPLLRLTSLDCLAKEV
jgi:hypothetical protein